MALHPKVHQHDFKLYSGERVPSLRPDDIAIDHVGRYQLAAALMAEKDYRFGLDLFCGSGYGTRILGHKLGAHVLGIDGSLESIQQASKLTADINILYSHRIFPFTLPSAWADFIVSCESLEHVEQYTGLARVMADTLKPGGSLFVSAPNELQLPLVQNPYHWHYRHFLVDDMVSLFEDLGLNFVKYYGSTINIIDNKKSVDVNFFSPASGRLLPDDNQRDTLFYHFEKKR